MLFVVVEHTRNKRGGCTSYGFGLSSGKSVPDISFPWVRIEHSSTPVVGEYDRASCGGLANPWDRWRIETIGGRVVGGGRGETADYEMIGSVVIVY